MARAILISENELERDYQIPNGQIITLKLDDDYTQITYWGQNGEQLGSDQDFIFQESEFNHNHYLLARMYVPIKGAGLGRASLEMFTELTGSIVYTRQNDGMKRDDGSHLTEDAPGFVTIMQKEGLIEEHRM